jgi:uncharacterized protein (TIGR03000 family)
VLYLEQRHGTQSGRFILERFAAPAPFPARPSQAFLLLYPAPCFQTDPDPIHTPFFLSFVPCFLWAWGILKQISFVTFAPFENNTMMVHRCRSSNGFAWFAKMAVVFLLSSAFPSAGWAQFIRTPAEAMAATGDRIPASWYGYPINDPAPFSYYGGVNYREYYGYGRGYGIAGFPTPVPGPAFFPDRRPLYTQYPENGEIYVRSGRPVLTPPLPLEVGKAGKINIELPAEATLWIAGSQSTQTGPTRAYQLPPLAPGKLYLYELRARWTEKGQPREETRNITVQPGSEITVRFPFATPLRNLPKLDVE